MLEVMSYSMYTGEQTVMIETDDVTFLAYIKKYLDEKMHHLAALNDYEGTIEAAKTSAKLVEAWEEIKKENKHEGIEIPCIDRIGD